MNFVTTHSPVGDQDAKLYLEMFRNRARGGSSDARDSGDRDHQRDRLLAQLDQLREVLDACQEGVLVFNQNLTLSLANTVARQQLNLGKALPPTPGDERIESLARRALVEQTGLEDVLDVWRPGRSVLKLTATPLGIERGVVVTLLDIAAEQRATLVRRQFVSHASHELKSPVAGIHALAEAVEASLDEDPKKTRSFLQQLISETSRLGALVGDLLDLSRLEEPSAVPINSVGLHTLAEEELGDIETQARREGIHINTSLDVAMVKGDDHQLRVLLRNLLDNALRHTPSEGTINVVTATQPDAVLLSVEDTGSGIPLTAQGRVFERFFRVDEGRGRKEGGTGLGLAIVKHVVELHGGTVELKSTLGEGSVFTVRFPPIEDA